MGHAVRRLFPSDACSLCSRFLDWEALRATMNVLHCPFWPQDSVLLLLYCVLCATFSITGLLCIRVALWRQRWFRAVIPLIIVTWLATGAGAHDIAMTSLVQMVLTVLTFRIGRLLLRPRRERAGRMPFRQQSASDSSFQFGVMDLLLSVVVIAWIVATACSAPYVVWEYWREIAVLGVGLSFSTLAALCIVVGKKRLAILVLEFVLVVGTVAWIWFTKPVPWDSPIAVCLVVWALMIAWLSTARIATHTLKEGSKASDDHLLDGQWGVAGSVDTLTA